MQACGSCHAITPCHEYSFQDLLGLYRDYRSETYNKDRISVEPDYARIAKNVGNDPIEINNRNTAVDRFLSKNASHFAGGAMVDYGGSDGRFIPSFAYGQFESIYIYDVSKAPLHSSVDARKVKKIAEPRLEAYSFLTCMHVLEHVGDPRSLVAEATGLLAPGGLIYIEVPLELTQSMREDFAQRIIDAPIIIHEHLNKFDCTSIRSLVKSIAGLELIDDAEDVVEHGWINGLNGRFLAKKIK
jgi:2-polyprenyl-3-methyl-5-hydroxy-6-metoxy-1,4-benzoquinol methylase